MCYLILLRLSKPIITQMQDIISEPLLKEIVSWLFFGSGWDSNRGQLAFFKFGLGIKPWKDNITV